MAVSVTITQFKYERNRTQLLNMDAFTADSNVNTNKIYQKINIPTTCDER